MNPPILQEILATVPDDGTRVEDIQVYANWIISKAQRPAISTLFHGMPGLPPPVLRHLDGGLPWRKACWPMDIVELFSRNADCKKIAKPQTRR